MVDDDQQLAQGASRSRLGRRRGHTRRVVEGRSQIIHLGTIDLFLRWPKARLLVLCCGVWPSSLN